MRAHCLKLNPLKCAFGVQAENFLIFLVYRRGVEIDKNKSRAVMKAKSPSNKKELQRFLGQVNYLRRFISNLAGKMSRPEPHGSMTGTREWEYIKYPKSIVSLDNFSRIKTLTITIIKLHFKYFSFIVAIKNTP